METIIKPQAKWWLFDWKELWSFRDLFYIFTWRDIKVRYKQTAIGIAWVLLQPLVNTFIFSVFFGKFAQIPSGKLPYEVFVLIGLIFWGYFSQALARSANSLIENQHLVKKIYFPREILPLSAVVTAFVDFLVSAALLAVVFVIFRIVPNLLFISLIIPSVLIAALSSAGLGFLLSAINVKYRDVRYIVPFFLQLLIFISPVIYPLNIVRPSFRYILALNPMSGVIEALRSSLGEGIIEYPDLLLISAVSAVILFFVGLFYFRLAERDFADIL